MGLIELRQAALSGLVELVVIAGALVDCLRKSVRYSALELRRIMPESNLEAVIDRLPGIVDFIDRAEIWIQIAIDSGVIRHGINFAVWHLQRVGSWCALRWVKSGRERVGMEAEIPIRLSRHSVGVSQQSQTVGVHITDAERGMRADLSFYLQVSLFHIGATEIWREHDQRRRAARTGGEGSKVVGIGYDRGAVAKRRPWDKQELAIDAIRRQRLRNVEQVGHGIEQSECPANHGGAFFAERICKSGARRDVILAIRNIAGHRKSRIALRRLRQFLQIPTHTVGEREMFGGAALVLREEGVGWDRENRRTLSKGLQVIFEISGGYYRARSGISADVS